MSSVGEYLNENDFMHACSQFGLDNPVPSVTKRLAWYGNTEELEKMVERVSNKLKNEIKAAGMYLDPEAYTPCENDKEKKKDVVQPVKIKDLQETLMAQSKMGRRAGLTDMKLFASDQPKDSFLSPPEAVLTRTYRLKIKDIRAFGEPDYLKPQSDVTFPSDEVGMTNGKQIVVPSMGSMSEMFQNHFHILRSLKRRINLLTQAYYQ